jgi:hypothetical protein
MPQYKFSLVSGLKQSSRRAVGFLTDPSDPKMNGLVKFQGLRPSHDRTLRTRFEHWIDGNIKPNWFHGWPQDQNYKKCITFKWDENKVHNRLYGYTCHPSTTNPSFQVSVLIFHDTKEDVTNFSILNRILVISESAAALNSIREIFPVEEK